ncbi:MAG: hypothetical protein N2484_05395 [Clostridia bacterium]|nr:hypothetical protein [Clostridia bacterium]
MEYSEFWVTDRGSKPCSHSGSQPGSFNCPQLPGTVLRISIPPGAVINLLNLIEVTSPGGICLIIRLPFLGGTHPHFGNLAGIMDAIRAAGGSVEVVK